MTQEIRNPRSGQFTLSVAACGGGSSPEFFKQAFLDNFTCRLSIFRYSDVTKNMPNSQLLGQSVFRPEFAAADRPAYKTFELSEFLGTRVGNANFSIGIGIGVAVVIEKSSSGVLEWPAAESTHSAFVRIDDVSLDFVGKRRLANQK